MLNRPQRRFVAMLAGWVLAADAAVVQCLGSSTECLNAPTSSAASSRFQATRIADVMPHPEVTQARGVASSVSEHSFRLSYFLYLTESWPSEKQDALHLQKQRGTGAKASSWIELFEPSSFFKSEYAPHISDSGLYVVAIEFQQDGSVLTRNSLGRPLVVRLEKETVSLVDKDKKSPLSFKLAQWSTGPKNKSSSWSPALCDEQDIPPSSPRSDVIYRYGPAFNADGTHAVFGCREWAHQLYEPSRPYIDVTNYRPRQCVEGQGEDEDEPSAYLSTTVGWSRFGDARKPVIGWYEYAWFCFYDCPAGEKPGRIDDIDVWTTRFGWQTPEPPSRMPMFPDSPDNDPAAATAKEQAAPCGDSE